MGRDRNQSRQVTDKVGDELKTISDKSKLYGIMPAPLGPWFRWSPLDESRAALIAHYTLRGGLE